MTPRAILFDLSGVLYDGDELIPGAVEAVREARERCEAVRFVTNTATRSAEAIREKVAGFGIEAGPEELFTAPLAAKAYAEKHGLRPYLLVHPAIESAFAGLECRDPNCVIIGDAREELTYEALNHAFRLCREGAELIAIGYNKYFSKDGELWLDGGAFVRAVEWAADVDAVIMGKPGKAFFDEVVASTGLDAKDCLMVGDDLEGDVIGALDAGLQACLVQTGKYQTGDDENLPEEGVVLPSVAGLFDGGAGRR